MTCSLSFACASTREREEPNCAHLQRCCGITARESLGRPSLRTSTYMYLANLYHPTAIQNT